MYETWFEPFSVKIYPYDFKTVIISGKVEQSVYLYVQQKETLDASPGNESVANLIIKSSALFLTSSACGNSKVSAVLEVVV